MITAKAAAHRMEIVLEFISTVYIVKDKRVLLTWNKNINAWIPLGGHIEKNELPCLCAVREAKEESGLDIELLSVYGKSKTANLVQPVHVHLDHITENHKHINLIYFGRVLGGKMMDQSDEGTALNWFTREEIEATELLPNIKEWSLDAIKHFRC